MSALIQRSFAGGEVAPALHARADLQRYATWLATCRNFIIGKSGGAYNRPGTTFIGEVKDSSGFVPRIISFKDSFQRYYLIEFGHLYFRVISSGSYVSDASASISGITKSNPIVVTAASHGFSNGDEVAISGVSGMTELNGRNFKVATVTTNTFTLKAMDGTTDVDSSAYGTWTSGGTASRIFTTTHTFNDNSAFDPPKLRRMTHSQWGNAMVFADNGEVTYELVRSNLSLDTGWTWQTMTVGPVVSTPGSVTNNGGGSGTTYWVVTAISYTGEESSTSSATSSSAVPTASAPITISWASVAGAREYRVYRAGTSGYYGFIGSAFSTSFIDSGFSIDLTRSPYKTTSVPWADSRGTYPGVVAHAQQRRILARDTANTQDPNGIASVWTSAVGSATNFNSGDPITDADPVTFTLAPSDVARIQHVIELVKILILTDTSEIYCQGNDANILTPTAVNTNSISYNGSTYLRPVKAGDKVLYVQERGTVVHDISYDGGQFSTDELSLIANHLFENHQIVSWAYQKTPNSVVWAVREDGVLLSLTYIKKQEIIAWARHDLGSGLVREVEVLPEGKEHVLYLIVDRIIGGTTKRYIEKMTTRVIDDVVDAKFVDCSLSYDGRNTGSTTMTLTGSGWTHTDTLTLTASAATFVSTDVGNEIQVYLNDEVVRCRISGYTSSTVVSVHPHKTVPSGLRSVATTDWVRAVDEVTGLWHLEGQNVSVFADGFVVANPNNPAYTVRTVASGKVTLDKPYGVIHVGLPYTSDLETLDIDIANGETMSDKHKNVTQVTAHLEKTRGGWFGVKQDDDDGVTLEGFTELKVRNKEGYDDPVSLKTGKAKINIQPEWNSNGRILIRQTDPLPITVLAVVPTGYFPMRGS